MLEHLVKPLGITYKAALDEIGSTKAAILGLNDQQFIIPPAHGEVMSQIINTLETN